MPEPTTQNGSFFCFLSILQVPTWFANATSSRYRRTTLSSTLSLLVRMEGSAECRGVSIPAEHHRSRCPTWNEWAQFIFQKRYKPSAIRSRDLRQLLFLSLPRRARLTRVINNISTSHRTSRGRSGPNLNRTKAS